jgi:hypothetical protein
LPTQTVTVARAVQSDEFVDETQQCLIKTYKCNCSNSQTKLVKDQSYEYQPNKPNITKFFDVTENAQL